MKDFKNVVIWGHKLGTHTCSYIHNGYYEAFKRMGYNTLYLDDKDNVEGINFANSLFFTEGQVDKRIPIRADCKYILHNCNCEKYIAGNATILGLAVFCKDSKTGEKINDYTYFSGRTLCQPWATDLLPNEIVPNMEAIENTIYYVGSVTGGWSDTIKICEEFSRGARSKNINFKIFGGYTGNMTNEYFTAKSGFISNADAIKYIRKSYLAPIFQSLKQQSIEYVPCRIFKNISYGKIGLTNCEFLENFFEEPIIYNSDTYQLFFDAEEKKNTQNLDKLMQIVKEKHTFINRINQILEVL